jgi:hypothetical protein
MDGVWYGRRRLCRALVAWLVGEDGVVGGTEPTWALGCQLHNSPLSWTCLSYILPLPTLYPLVVFAGASTAWLGWDTVYQFLWLSFLSLSSLGPIANCFSYILISDP